MRLTPVLLALVLVASPTLAPTAHAQEEVCSPYNNVQLRKDVVEIGRALDAADIKEARYLLTTTRAKLRCLDRLVEPTQLATFARQMALLFFYDQDPETARRWGLLSRAADPDLPWDKFNFPPDHPFREALEEEEDAFIGRPAGKALNPPKRGGIFMNGRLITVPEAPAEVPLLMQVADAKGQIVVGFWQEGARFPDAILTDGTHVAATPKWYDGDVSAATTTAVAASPSPKEPRAPREPKAPASRSGDGLPIVPVAIAGGLLAGAGGLLVGAAISHGRLDKASTEQQLVGVQTTTNLLTLSAGALGLGAVGVGATVFLLDEGAGAGFRVRW